MVQLLLTAVHFWICDTRRNLTEYKSGRERATTPSKPSLKPSAESLPPSLPSSATSADSKTSYCPDLVKKPSEGAMTTAIL